MFQCWVNSCDVPSVFWSGLENSIPSFLFLKIISMEEPLIQLEKGAECLRLNFSLWEKLSIRDDWFSRGLFSSRGQPFMSGGFAQRLTLIMCLSNYLLHDLFFLCCIAPLLRALLLAPPSVHRSNQLITMCYCNSRIRLWFWHVHET